MNSSIPDQYRFKNRREAGRLLADALAQYASVDILRLLALPRGGVPVAFEIAQQFNLPMELFLVRKLGVPGDEEFAMGAVASGEGLYLDMETIGRLKIPAQEIDRVIARETEELRRREQAYGLGPELEVTNEVVALIDDGLATGASMRSAVRALRRKGPRRIIVAVPVGSAGTCGEMKSEADEVLCLYTPIDFHAVGEWYEDFSQTTDDEVVELLAKSKRMEGAKR